MKNFTIEVMKTYSVAIFIAVALTFPMGQYAATGDVGEP
jgi:hypothetical protein